MTRVFSTRERGIGATCCKECVLFEKGLGFVVNVYGKLFGNH